MRKQILTAAILTSCAGTTAAVAAELGENTTVGGQAFFDFSHIQLQNENAAGQKIDTGPTGTGFDIKRFYLSADHRFSDVWAADVTVDAQYSTASTSTITTTNNGTTTNTTVLTNQNSSGGVSEVFIKKLYLEGKFSDALVVHAGSYSSPWTSFVEALYGYRYIEKTTTDRLGFANTADWGLNATGKFGPNNILGYSFSVVDGAGYKNPSRSKSPDYEGRVSVVPLSWLTVGGGFYAGHLGQVTAANQDFKQRTATRFNGAAAVNIVGVRAGVEYFVAKNYKTVNSLAASVYGTSSVVASSATTAPVSDKADGESAFISYSFNSQYQVFGRYDHTNLSKDVASDLKDEYFNIGAVYKPLKTLDLAVVYKNEKVDHGSNSISGADANGSYTIGGANGKTDGHFNEVGFYAQWSW
jgi:hypothetical protein